MQHFRNLLIFVLVVVAGDCLHAGVHTEVDVPFAYYTKPLGVLPIVVSLETTGEFNGTLRVQHGNDEALVQRISVGQGSFRFEVACPVDSRSGNVSVELTDSSKEPIVAKLIPFRIVVPQNDRERRLTPWIIRRAILPTEVGAALRDFSDDNSGLHLVGTDTRVLRQALAKEGLLVSPILSKETFSNWQMYRGVHCILISDGGGVDMSKDQVRALDGWVRAGGSVCISPDAVPAGFEGCPFNRAFAQDMQSPGHIRQRGLGTVVLAPKGLRQYLSKKSCHALGRLVDEAVRGQHADSWSAPRELRAALRHWVGLEAIRRGIIMAYALVFLVCATIVERYFLKRFRILHWTWLTTTAICAVFCLMATSVSYAVRGTESRHAGLCLHDFEPSGGSVSHLLDCFIPADTKKYVLRHDGWAAVRRLNRSRDGASTIRMDLQGIEVRNPVWTSVYTSARRPLTGGPVFDGISGFRDGVPVGAELVRNDWELAYPAQFLILDRKLYMRGTDRERWQAVGVVDAKLRIDWAAAGLAAADREFLREVFLATSAQLPGNRAVVLALVTAGPSLHIKGVQSRHMHVVRQYLVAPREAGQ